MQAHFTIQASQWIYQCPADGSLVVWSLSTCFYLHPGNFPPSRNIKKFIVNATSE